MFSTEGYRGQVIWISKLAFHINELIGAGGRKSKSKYNDA